MSKKISILVIAIALIASFGGLVGAQTAPKKPPAGGTFEQRLSQRKNERKNQLDDKEQRRLSSRCTKSQQVFRQLQQTTSRVADNRVDVYEQIDGKLWVTIGQLTLADVDTFSLERQRATLENKVEGFHEVMGYYRQTLDDIVVINCQADIVGFQALVDTARIYHKDLRARSADIRTYIIDDIKQTLSSMQEKISYVDQLDEKA